MNATQPPDIAVVPARYGEVLPNGRVQCNLCPNHCRLAEGQRGACFVRACHNGRLVLTTYGRSSGFCIDPVEKKPLYHFLPGSSTLSFGTAGCNLTCAFCQNWSISKSREADTLCAAASPEAIAAAARQHGCRSVSFTYNDPVIFLEYAVDVAGACRAEGLKTIAVTAGYICPEPRAEFFAAMDAANVDLKAFRKEFYRRLCGAGLTEVLDTLVYIRHATKVWLEITTLLIPGENDSTEEIRDMCRWIYRELGPDVPLHFTAFHPDYKLLDRPRTPLATLERACGIAREEGINYVYTGNVRDRDGASTTCPGCGAMLIGRDGFDVVSWQLAPGGVCRSCRRTCPGVFDDNPGAWGSRRLSVAMT